MAVVLMIEWDNAKDESRYKKYGEQTREGRPEWMKKLVEEGIVKGRSWADNTGHIVAWFEFDNIEAFAQLWGNEEWQNYWLRRNPVVDNVSFRLLRPAVTIPE